MESRNHFDKLIVVFGVLFTIVTLVSVGADLGSKDTDITGVAIGFLTSFFWLGIVALTIWTRFASQKDKTEAARRDLEMVQRRNDAAMAEQNKVAVAPARPEMPAELKGFMEDVLLPTIKKAKEHAHDHEMLEAVIADLGGYPLDEAKAAEVEKAFHENTDRYVKIEFEPDMESFSCEFSDKPIEAGEPVPGRSEAHEAARKRGDAARAKDAPKKLSASQQRRINASKGHGPITDAELRDKRNEERRAKRAAKKQEAATTTTTTTQPGQTSLV